MLDNDLVIKEYDPGLAKGIAEMWNNSGEGWNGDNTHHTEISVRNKESVSSHLNLYLALIGDKVVGYCKLSKYYFDENTLYIDLLNVDPRYFNQKIGKALVKLAVEKTIELGYPRLDLFTWAGNTKAVPLYKKCGFFWEKREDSNTHLMNFIPTVMQTPLLSDYFETLDWYDDSTRPIVVEADGRTENNFDYYTYTWEKDGTRLRVEFEKSGRGIHSIETDEFRIHTEISNGKLVFGQKYPVKYHFTNKTSKAQQIEIKGMDNKNIRFLMHQSISILDTQTIEGEFYLDSVETEQNMWKNHPAVCAEISVDGKSAIFKTGINPQFPLRMFAGKKESMLFAGREEELYLNVENNFNEDCTFEITFPPQQDIIFSQETVEISLQAHERNCLPLGLTASNSLIYNQRVNVKASFSKDHDLCYNQPFSMILYVPEGKAKGENNERCYIINSRNILTLEKDDDLSEMFFKNLHNNLYWCQGYPKLGLPYSAEFLLKLPDKVEYLEDAATITLKAYYSSDDFPGCKFVSCYRLYCSGMLEYYTELLAFPDGLNEIVLSRSFWFEGRQMLMPYSGMIMQTDDTLHNDSGISNWNSDKIDENWLHCATRAGNMSIVWHKEDKLICCEWNYAIEHKFKKGESACSNPVYVAFDVFPNIKKLREFALGKKVEALIPSSFYDLQLNFGNPFWDDESPLSAPEMETGVAVNSEHKNKCQLSYLDYRHNPLECTVQISSINCEDIALCATATKIDELHELSFDLYPHNEKCIDIISAKASYPTKSFCVDKILIRKQTMEIRETVEQLGDNTIYTVDNGVVRFKVSPQYAPLVYSLIYDKHEWIDNSFPERSPKSWWNPWCGGFENVINNMKRDSWHSEKHEVSFVAKEDNFAQVWKGMEIKTKIENYDSLKGVTVCQYFLVLPGLPVVLTYCTYQQEKGFYRRIEAFSRVFVKADDDIRNSAFELTRDDKVLATKCGIEDIGFETEGKLLACSGLNRKEKLYFYCTKAPVTANPASDTLVSSLLFNYEVILKDSAATASQLKFVILSDLNISEKALIDLDNIVFEDNAKGTVK